MIIYAIYFLNYFTGYTYLTAASFENTSGGIFGPFWFFFGFLKNCPTKSEIKGDQPCVNGYILFFGTFCFS